ncbi:XRE family transcriptional regulator [Xanthomonas sp. LMG 8992]|uniref:helix-turn-helix domain-containing protein n=1 Tax=Xanthomonas sp. LMG 8992 TaxID=1591157 RepID=UPI00136AA4CB|nr:helix-turn-helix transcriptional regulator [Xanthomonas sp. LMG 8992]MXV11653.1 XRE family transcriptional regulator [Xanthomonas sp. LMG 8992]
MNKTSAIKPHPIRAARIARNWTQRELGQRLQPPVGKGAVAQWESDATRPVPELGVQLVDLFDREFTLEDLYRRPGRAS